ncbi:hypothetical protein [Streptomyces sp. NPDC006610]|uniref:hypothetical protein n=1 Tax=Streptomyces sp. NPDC006610 TaxID=3154584 RepID=UPI0033B87538
MTSPRTPLGRFGPEGRLQYVGRTTTLAKTAGTAVAGMPHRARRGHPWTGWSFSAGRASRKTLDVTLVEPELMVKVGVDVARDTSGRWRHAARWHRARPDAPTSPLPTPLLVASEVTAARARGRRVGPGSPQLPDG